jgi:hypothetical protein
VPTFEFNSITREFDITGDSASSLSNPVTVAQGGTGQTGVQAAINVLTQSASGTEGQVLTVQSSAATFQLPRLPQYDADPSSPASGEAWVLREDSGGTAGNPIGLLITLMQTVGVTSAYTLKYKTTSGTVVSVGLT